MGEGFKLGTQIFRKQVSQGLLMQVTTFPEIKGELAEGMDVTELLGVKKWEIEERATTGGNMIGTLPYSIPHTDEVRVQTCPELIEAFRGKEYYITTKMDGSSHSVSVDKDGFHVTGHNYEYKDDDSSGFYRYIKKTNLKGYMIDYVKEHDLDSLTIQGEFCAPGIQKNRLKLQAPEWYVFTIMENGNRIGMKKMIHLCDIFNLSYVPIEEEDYNLPEKYPTVEALLERADGEYPNGGKKEGIVIRPMEPEYCDLITAPLSMKVVNNKYLLINE